MNIIWHESPYVDSIFHVPADMYVLEHDYDFRGMPSVHEHIILNENCAQITFSLQNEVFVSDSNVVCGKFTHPPKINITFKDAMKKLTVIRLNSYGMFKLTNMPISSMVNRITPGAKISIDLSDHMGREHSMEWIEAMLQDERQNKAYEMTREIIHFINANFTDLPSNVSRSIAEQFGISESTLLRYFKKYIGVTLSTYLVTLKRKKMIRAMCREKHDSLTAQQSGYYDQSHFINDFKRLFGISLKEYFNEMKKMKKRSPELLHFMYGCPPES